LCWLSALKYSSVDPLSTKCIPTVNRQPVNTHNFPTSLVRFFLPLIRRLSKKNLWHKKRFVAWGFLVTLFGFSRILLHTHFRIFLCNVTDDVTEAEMRACALHPALSYPYFPLSLLICFFLTVTLQSFIAPLIFLFFVHFAWRFSRVLFDFPLLFMVFHGFYYFFSLWPCVCKLLDSLLSAMWLLCCLLHFPCCFSF